MAKAGINIAIEPFTQTNPVSRERKTFWRNAHNHQTSKRLKDFQACVRSEMEGKTFRGQGAVTDSRNIRSAFTSAAKACSGRGA